MAETTSVRSNRRAGKPGGKRKTANRFHKLAGGDASTDLDHSPATGSEVDDTGLIGGMSAVAAGEAHRVVELAVAEIAPHPFNDDTRSQPQPGNPKWEELLNAVRANGVRLPLLVVPREAFAAVRPGVAASIDEDARYVLIYGHRRRAAALEAGRHTVPAVVDDAIMTDDGDLDAMAAENLGREDLSELAEAELFARYSEVGLTQRAIAERLGVDQATVSRRLALLLLAPELRNAVADGRLPSAEAAALSGKLPYGPLRRWQKGKDTDQDTEARRTEQTEALRLVLDHGWLASRAAERIIAEREARAEAAALGVPLVDDPRAEFGDNYLSRRVSRDQMSPGADVLGAINPNTGQLDLYTVDDDSSAAAPAPDGPPPSSATTPAPIADDAHSAAGENAADEADGDDTSTAPPAADPAEAAAARAAEREAAAAAASQAHRRQSCAALITHQPSNAELLKLLVGQYLSGVAARCQTSAVGALLRDWDASAEGSGDKARSARAWHRAVAAAELHTAELGATLWDDDAVSHVEMLIQRVGYQPTEWEQRQLDTARR